MLQFTFLLMHGHYLTQLPTCNTETCILIWLPYKIFRSVILWATVLDLTLTPTWGDQLGSDYFILRRQTTRLTCTGATTHCVYSWTVTCLNQSVMYTAAAAATATAGVGVAPVWPDLMDTQNFRLCYNNSDHSVFGMLRSSESLVQSLVQPFLVWILIVIIVWCVMKSDDWCSCLEWRSGRTPVYQVITFNNVIIVILWKLDSATKLI